MKVCLYDAAAAEKNVVAEYTALDMTKRKEIQGLHDDHC